jgi:hypothetical protein
MTKFKLPRSSKQITSADTLQKLELINNLKISKENAELAESRMRNVAIHIFVLGKDVYSTLSTMPAVTEHLTESKTEDDDKGTEAISYFLKNYATKFMDVDGATIIDLCKKINEIFELQSKLNSHTQYYEEWIARTHQADYEYMAITKECNENFDELMAKASKSENPKIKEHLTYFNSVEKRDEQEYKNEFYCFLKDALATNKVVGVPIPSIQSSAAPINNNGEKQLAPMEKL